MESSWIWKDYKVEVDDPTSPGTKQKETIDLTQFENKPYDESNQVEPNKNEVGGPLPQSKKNYLYVYDRVKKKKGKTSK